MTVDEALDAVSTSDWFAACVLATELRRLRAQNAQLSQGVSSLRAYAFQQASKLRVLRSLTHQKQGEAYQDLANRLRDIESQPAANL